MKKTLIILLALLPLCITAQGQNEQYSSEPEPQYSTTRAGEQPKTNKKDKKILTGFSGGMMIHGGYAFSSNPQELFRNGSFPTTSEQIKNLPSDGMTLGLGGALRFHLVDHIHLGGEGHVSMMPLMKSGSSIRMGWGGALCDFYANLGIVRPLIGVVIGGGTMKRLYVPENAEKVKGEGDVTYNASYTSTSFFLLDPYVGLEIALGKMALFIKADYALPFGSSGSVLQQKVFWSNFITPSGPRLYVGVMFGH